MMGNTISQMILLKPDDEQMEKLDIKLEGCREVYNFAVNKVNESIIRREMTFTPAKLKRDLMVDMTKHPDNYFYKKYLSNYEVDDITEKVFNMYKDLTINKMLHDSLLRREEFNKKFSMPLDINKYHMDIKNGLFYIEGVGDIVIELFDYPFFNEKNSRVYLHRSSTGRYYLRVFTTFNYPKNKNITYRKDMTLPIGIQFSINNDKFILFEEKGGHIESKARISDTDLENGDLDKYVNAIVDEILYNKNPRYVIMEDDGLRSVAISAGVGIFDDILHEEYLEKYGYRLLRKRLIEEIINRGIELRLVRYSYDYFKRCGKCSSTNTFINEETKRIFCDDCGHETRYEYNCLDSMLNISIQDCIVIDTSKYGGLME